MSYLRHCVTLHEKESKMGKPDNTDLASFAYAIDTDKVYQWLPSRMDPELHPHIKFGTVFSQHAFANKLEVADVLKTGLELFEKYSIVTTEQMAAALKAFSNGESSPFEERKPTKKRAAKPAEGRWVEEKLDERLKDVKNPPGFKVGLTTLMTVAPLSSDAELVLSSNSSAPGSTLRVVRHANEEHVLTVNGVKLKDESWSDFTFNGFAWILSARGQFS